MLRAGLPRPAVMEERRAAAPAQPGAKPIEVEALEAIARMRG